MQNDFVDTWSGAYFNDRAGFGIGQVYCNPDDPKPGALNPDPAGLNNMADGSFIIKLLFSTVTEAAIARRSRTRSNGMPMSSSTTTRRWRNQDRSRASSAP